MDGTHTADIMLLFSMPLDGVYREDRSNWKDSTEKLGRGGCLHPWFVASPSMATVQSLYINCYVCISGHQHQGNYRRHRHSGIPNFSPVPDQKKCRTVTA
jgi:hypothetical protein